MGDNAGSHGELDRGRVDDAYDVARSGSLEDSKELAVAAVLGVKLDHLLVVVGSLKKLNPGIERPAICGQEPRRLPYFNEEACGSTPYPYPVSASVLYEGGMCV